MHQPIDAICNAFELRRDAEGVLLTGGLPVAISLRTQDADGLLLGLEPQIVVVPAGGVLHEELNLFNPYRVQFVVYHTDEQDAFERAHIIVDGLRETRSVGGEEKPWELEGGWVIRDQRVDVPILLESLPVTDSSNTLYGVAVLVHFVLAKR